MPRSYLAKVWNYSVEEVLHLNTIKVVGKKGGTGRGSPIKGTFVRGRTKTDSDRQGVVEKVLRRKEREERDGVTLALNIFDLLAAFSRTLYPPS